MKPASSSFRKTLICLSAVLTIGVTSSFAPKPVVPGNDKITICHLPPGNPANRQTISISVNALQAHLDHGDFVGDCSPTPPTGTNEGGGIPTAPSTPTCCN